MSQRTADAFRANKWAALILALAALYNLVWGTFVVLAPAPTLALVGLDRASPVELWQCIGMLVGVYGVAYWIAATDPRRHRAVVLVGFLGKVFGPLGTLVALYRGTLPPSFLLVNLTNDLMWLGPFAWILWRFRARSAAGGRPSGSLYRDLMGPDFDRLGPVLRAFHAAETPIEVRGSFSVARGSSRLSNWLADRAGFPGAQKDIPVRLRVTPDRGGEVWARSFDERSLVSRQWNASGLLAERFGPVTLFLALRAVEASLEIIDVRATFLGIPVPPLLSPRVLARGTDDQGGVRLRVRLDLGVIGLLVEYGGLVWIVGGPGDGRATGAE